MLRGRASRRLEESTLVRDNLRGLCRAINAYADVMRRHREGLEQLHACASGTGLEVPGNRIMPPVETIKDATERRGTRGRRAGRPIASASTARSSCVTSDGSAPAS